MSDFLNIAGLNSNSSWLHLDYIFEVNRDYDWTIATVKLLKENLPCDEVVIAIPYENQLARDATKEIESAGGKIVDVKELTSALNQF